MFFTTINLDSYHFQTMFADAKPFQMCVYSLDVRYAFHLCPSFFYSLTLKFVLMHSTLIINRSDMQIS